MNRPSAKYLDLPFEEAIEFFRQKVNLPSKRWDDLWQGMHSRAFVVAGATRAELLTDLRAAVDKAISKGTTLADFRKDFDALVEKHGWNHKGGRAWRSGVIFDTNLSVAYAAGNHRQMTDQAVLAVRPYWRYLPSSSANRRQDHRRWYNLVLRHDDPFWRTHRPPNDWGCKCGVASLSKGELERLKKEEAGSGLPIRTEAPAPEYYDYVNRRTGEVTQVPVGIGPGWDYNPGEAAWGKRLSEQAMAEYQAMKKDAWESLTPGDWQTYGLGKVLEPRKPEGRLYPATTDKAEALSRLREVLGGEEHIYGFAAEGFRYDVLVNAQSLIDHIAVDLAARSPFLGLIPETLSSPQEVWLSFERHRGTGLVVLRQRILKVVQVDKQRAMCVVINARNGMLEAWTFFPRSKMGTVGNLRQGQLVWRAE